MNTEGSSRTHSDGIVNLLPNRIGTDRQRKGRDVLAGIEHRDLCGSGRIARNCHPGADAVCTPGLQAGDILIDTAFARCSIRLYVPVRVRPLLGANLYEPISAPGREIAIFETRIPNKPVIPWELTASEPGGLAGPRGTSVLRQDPVHTTLDSRLDARPNRSLHYRYHSQPDKNSSLLGTNCYNR